ncbi:hypothetical protein BCU70_05620 [Vibrio sp. 10N.286.49.C2]|uniref:nuclear transport factor 2 family protein n=1 Tax=unclassified Vibrio TaxID=2614977 RepID=UPI000C8669DB|nr:MULTISPECIES: hypothetical protein [unclassified Vibrio]PMH33954.1 hypothetical protein BCU70_05620 [Vibrio sp. 10N.286.49.C2]PMH44213.1 hypothetical protein BCU66_04540 [Vibrio sp. 10N.286.49.B1]PMH79941.1 hypothetical protein BCU58_04280 [Vibrio sp. 10N.286.48.B7]
MSKKLKSASNLYLDGIRDGNIQQAVRDNTGRRYTQHSTGVKNGIEGFIEFFEPFLVRCPIRDIQIVRSIVDGQYVFLQAYQDINNGDAKWVTTDLFDTDNLDKIIEHWDVISAFEPIAGSINDAVNGPTEIHDLEKTDTNKETVRNFLCDVMVLGHRERLADYIDLDELVVHASKGVGVFDDYVGSYDHVFKIIGQGNFVVAFSRVKQEGQEIARFDIFSLQGGKIRELWVNQELVPPKVEWVNGGKF